MAEGGDDTSEVGQLFALTVDELRSTQDANHAQEALRELWARVEDPAMLREAVQDAGGTWADLLSMFG
jgi:hypothetical protein